MTYRKGYWDSHRFADQRIEELETLLDQERESHKRTKRQRDELRDALDYLLEQTVDQDLKHGIGLTEDEEDARQRALAVIAKVGV